jgi:putative ABC transport system permease protein
VLVGGELRATSLLFIGVVGFVLLICCANVANLLLARATVRTRELGIRSALGASRSRVIRQLITESLVLAALGGALGLAIGAAILQIAPSIIPPGVLPAVVTLSFDLRVVAFSAVTALLVGLLFGIAPSWQATGFSLTNAISAESRSVTGRGGRLRSLLVIGEVATAVFLLFGAGLLLRTLMAVEFADRGFRAEGVLTMYVDPLASAYPTRDSLLRFFDDVEREVGTVPGVRSVAWASTVPFGAIAPGQASFEIAGEARPQQSQRPIAALQTVSPAYFKTLDLPVVTGRAFDERDTSESTAVCIVNEAFVRNYLNGRSPLGVRIATRPASAVEAEPVLREIVGVARQAKGRPDELEELLQVYIPMAQNPTDDIYMLVRSTSESADALTTPVRAAIGRIDKAQLVGIREVRTLEDVAWQATALHRFRAVLIATFAALALFLAMVGVFGVLAYTVQQRVRDFGVRRALGATSGDLFRLVLGSAFPVVAVGAIVGLALSAAFSRVLATMLFGVRPLDPATFVLVSIALAVTAVVATAGPAWRATRIDPVVALRGD